MNVYHDEQTKQWAMFLHLSVLLSHVVPLAGIIAPIVIWQVKKDELPAIDVHGRNAVNFLISFFIYVMVSAILCVVLIGIPFLICLLYTSPSPRDATLSRMPSSA